MVSAETLWTNLPVNVRDALILSAHKSSRMYKIFNLVLKNLNQDWGVLQTQDKQDLLLGLAIRAFEDEPWNLQSFNMILHCNKIGIQVPNSLLNLAQQGSNVSNEIIKHLSTVTTYGEKEQALNVLRSLKSIYPNLIVLLGYAAQVTLFAGKTVDFKDFYDDMNLEPLLKHMLDGLTYFAQSEWDLAAKSYKEAIKICELPGLYYRLGDCLYRSADAQSKIYFKHSLLLSPWDSGLILRLADMYVGLDHAGTLPSGRGVILIYSWNNASDLNEMLTSLLKSDLGSCKVLLLNNGSTDDTMTVVRRMVDMFGGRLRDINLPVNVGAPAARNWLIEEPETKASVWFVFLDDDILLPGEWLGHMGSALTMFPDAAIIGCQVSPSNQKYFVQTADLHLVSRALSDTNSNDRHLARDDFYTNLFDFGFYSYIRPCTSVTGCCHLLKRRALEQIGGFDIIFSPSQYDDFERDLRASLNTQIIVFNGHLKILHKRRSVLIPNTEKKRRFVATGLGNHFKLLNLITEKQSETIRRIDYANVFDYLLRKIMKINMEMKI